MVSHVCLNCVTSELVACETSFRETPEISSETFQEIAMFELNVFKKDFLNLENIKYFLGLLNLRILSKMVCIAEEVILF